jgi:hypothetical protein
MLKSIRADAFQGWTGDLELSRDYIQKRIDASM